MEVFIREDPLFYVCEKSDTVSFGIKNYAAFSLRQSEDLLVLHFLSNEHDFVSIKITKILKWVETTLEIKYDESEFCPPVTRLWFRVHSKQKPISYCRIYFFSICETKMQLIFVSNVYVSKRKAGVYSVVTLRIPKLL